MFEPTSRYARLRLKDGVVTDGRGGTRVVRHVERRFLPPAQAGATLVEHTVRQGERLDQLTARYLGDPTQFWRVADANETLRPEDLTAEPGTIVRVALTQS